jgi:5'(3')-deoxyribonucleotidase
MHVSEKKPVIAVDIDDVLFPFVDGIAAYHNDLKGTTLTAKDFISYNFHEVWGGNQLETDGIIDAFLSRDHLQLLPISGAKEALERLSADFDIFLVTARNELFSDSTSSWLRHHLPGLFQHVFFAGNPHDGRPYQPKGVICQQLGAQLLIDDHPSNLKSAAECGVKGILFGSHAWSVADSQLAKHVTVCADWPAVLGHIYDQR